MVAGTAAVVGAAAAPNTVVYQTAPVAVLPCAATPVDVDGVTYFACGSDWYTQAYASSGAIYVQVAPPPGY